MEATLDPLGTLRSRYRLLYGHDPLRPVGVSFAAETREDVVGEPLVRPECAERVARLQSCGKELWLNTKNAVGALQKLGGPGLRGLILTVTKEQDSGQHRRPTRRRRAPLLEQLIDVESG